MLYSPVLAPEAVQYACSVSRPEVVGRKRPNLAFVFMAALRSRCGHYIFALWFLLSIYFFSSPNLSGRILDAYHTSTHDVALVRI